MILDNGFLPCLDWDIKNIRTILTTHKADTP